MVSYMFGYVTVNKPELKFKEFDIYIRLTIAVYAEFCVKSTDLAVNLL